MAATQFDTSPRPTSAPERHAEEFPVSAFVARSGEVEFKPGPINPEWILEGNPQARSAPLVSSSDGGGAVNFWDCTAGKFRWEYVWDETVMFLEGEVRVTDNAGHTTLFRAGDVAHFPAGSSFTWEIDHYVRKIAFHKKPNRSLRRFFIRYQRRVGVAVSVIGVPLLRLMMRRMGMMMLVSAAFATPIIESI